MMQIYDYNNNEGFEDGIYLLRIHYQQSPEETKIEVAEHCASTWIQIGVEWDTYEPDFHNSIISIEVITKLDLEELAKQG